MGSQLLPQVLSLRVVFGLDIRVSECYVTVPTLPSWIRKWDPVMVAAGPDPAHLYWRFGGYYLHNRRTLDPIGCELVCYGPLVRARVTVNNTEGGTDMANSPTGRTDEAVVELALDNSGLTTAELARLGMGRFIQGTGKTLGTVAWDVDDLGFPTGPLACRQGESWMAYVERLEEVTLGYRTFEAPSGYIVRTLAKPIPSSTAAHSFTEGVDIFSADLTEEILQIKNKVIATGYDINDGGGPFTYTASQESPHLRAPDGSALYVPQDIPNSMMEKSTSAEAGDGISCQEVGLWRLEVGNREDRRLRYTTPSGEILFPQQTVAIASPNRLAITDKFVIQHLEMTLRPEEGWAQALVVQGGVGSSAPIDRPPLGAFQMVCDVETVVVGGVEVLRYTVYCIDSSPGMSGAISTRAWTATGGSPSSGSGQTFSAVYSDVAGKAITLVVTDENGLQGSVTLPVPPASSPRWFRRPLYFAATVHAEAFDGSTTRTDAENASRQVTVVANGPLWAADRTAMRSADYLATNAPESAPFGAVTATALWMETDVSTSLAMAGAWDGRIAFSPDGGATWTVVDGLTSEPVLRVVINRYALQQRFRLSATNYCDTVDGGASWSVLHAAPEGHTFFDVAHSFDRAYLLIGDDGAGGPYAIDSGGVEQTFPVGAAGLIAVAARIEGGYAVLDSNGAVFLSESGSDTFTAAEPLPAGCTPLPRSMWRDGEMGGVFFIACGAAGVYKTIDAFGSAGGYYRIRQPGVGNSPVDAVYTQVGADGLPGGLSITETTVLSTIGEGKVYHAGTQTVPTTGTGEPDGWQQIGFDDSGWGAPVWGGSDSNPPAIAGTDCIDWMTHNGGGGASPVGDVDIHRKAFTLPAGVISSAPLLVRGNGYIDVWVNGLFVGQAHVYGTGDLSYNEVSVSIPPEYLIPGGDNAIAIRNQNEVGWGHGIRFQLVVS
jgi:hypothetical protein